MRVGFLGTGAIAEAMVRGITGRGFEILVSGRSAATAARLAKDCADVRIAENTALVEACDLVVLSLMAGTARDILPDLPFRADHKVISVMADAPFAELAAWLAPATRIEITIPLPAIARGGTHLPCFPSADIVTSLFGAHNTAQAVPSETALNAHFAATALCSVTLAQIAVTRDWLSAFGMAPHEAEGFITSMLAGALQDAGRGVDAALDSLNTEGGLNQTLRRHMHPSEARLKDGLDGFRTRLGLPEV